MKKIVVVILTLALLAASFPAFAGTENDAPIMGDTLFARPLGTLCGMPCLSLPLLTGANGLPLGVQLVGPRGGDARLLRTSRWLVGRVRST